MKPNKRSGKETFSKGKSVIQKKKERNLLKMKDYSLIYSLFISYQNYFRCKTRPCSFFQFIFSADFLQNLQFFCNLVFPIIILLIIRFQAKLTFFHKLFFSQLPLKRCSRLQPTRFLKRRLRHRRSRSHMFFKISVLKNFTNFTGKHLCWSRFLVNLQALGDVHVLFCEFYEILKNTFFIERLWRLLQRSALFI